MMQLHGRSHGTCGFGLISQGESIARWGFIGRRKERQVDISDYEQLGSSLKRYMRGGRLVASLTSSQSGMVPRLKS